jgi:hypothetical protein
MSNIGGLFGKIGLVSILYLFFRLILTLIVGLVRKNGKPLPDLLKKVNQFVTKTHRYVGILAVGAIILHFILQFTRYGFAPLSGLMAGGTLTVQAVLGLGLTRQKDKARRKKMALLHRLLGSVLVVAVLNHRLFKLGN